MSPAQPPRGGKGKGSGRGGGGGRGGGAAGRGAGGAGRGGRRGVREARVVWPAQQRESAREAIEGLMRERGLERGFEEAVEREARRAAERGRQRGGGSGGPTRKDLRELATFTIDPAAARDFDDAISAEPIAGGGVRVWVHIADVSAYVREGSAVDVEARERGTSVYVPGAVEPMLPRALSNEACSLLPGHDRAAVTVELELHGAEVRGAAFHRTVIRSDERLDYDRVDAIFAGREAARAPWGEPLAAARAAAAALGEARARRGSALTVESSEPEFRFDGEGNVSEIASSVQTESHRLIEHLMIAANEAVAEHLEQLGVPCLYRVHERPQVARVERLVDQLASLGVATPALPEQMSRARAGDLVGEISRLVEEHVQRTVARARKGDPAVAASGGRQALTTLVLRSLQQAYYSPSNLGHAGLGSRCYCHFTSPIRRYPDLVCHRALLATLGGPERAPRASTLETLGEWTSGRERAAMEIERDADDMARCFALERELLEVGWEQTFRGEVVGVIGAGAFVTFDRAGAEGGYRYEGMLPVRRLAAAIAEQPKSGVDGGGDGAPIRGPGLGTGRRGRPSAAPHVAGRGARAGAGGGRREWWELNEEGTILRGERSGTTLRLGDPIVVRVGRVDTQRGRVDLAPAQEEPAEGARVVRRGGRTKQREG
jgi:ribonuclease R